MNSSTKPSHQELTRQRMEHAEALRSGKLPDREISTW